MISTMVLMVFMTNLKNMSSLTTMLNGMIILSGHVERGFVSLKILSKCGRSSKNTVKIITYNSISVFFLYFLLILIKSEN